MVTIASAWLNSQTNSPGPTTSIFCTAGLLFKPHLRQILTILKFKTSAHRSASVHSSQDGINSYTSRYFPTGTLSGIHETTSHSRADNSNVGSNTCRTGTGKRILPTILRPASSRTPIAENLERYLRNKTKIDGGNSSTPKLEA